MYNLFIRMLLRVILCLSLIDLSMEIPYLDKTSDEYCSTSGCPPSNCSHIQIGHNTRGLAYTFCNVTNALDKEECFNLVKTSPHVWSVFYLRGCAVSECDTSDKLGFAANGIILHRKTCETVCLNFTMTRIKNCSSQPAPQTVLVETTSNVGQAECYGKCLPPVESCLVNFDLTTELCEVYKNIDTSNPIPCVQNDTRFVTYIVECVNDYCDPPPAISSGNVTYLNTSYLSTASYSCNTGYNMTGTATVTCGANIEWSAMPSCQIVDCNTPSNVTNAVFNVTNTTFSSTTSYACAVGYYLIGSSTISCLANGQWETPLPWCAVVDCNAPPIVTNALVLYTTTTHGSIATYSCLSSHLFLGRPNISCQASGYWSIPEINCFLKDTSTTPKRLYITPCACSTGRFTNMTSDEIIAYLQAETEIDPRETTLSQYKLKCRQDNRRSSYITGLTGVIVLIVIFVCIVLLDLLTLFRCSSKITKSSKVVSKGSNDNQATF